MAERGTTLAELLVVLAVAASVLALAVPGLSRQLLSRQISSVTNEFLAALHLARSEAVKRSSRAVVCPSSDGTHCSGDGWSKGWLIFHDVNNNAQRDEGEAVLHTRPSLPQAISVMASKPISTYISYAATGGTLLVSGAWQAGTLTLCGKAGSSQVARQIVINSTGRPRTTKPGTCPTP